MLEPFSGNNHIPDEQFKKLYSAWGKGERKMILTSRCPLCKQKKQKKQAEIEYSFKGLF
jgi:hypothetical protein